ncbi:uncharacterized protein LOC144094549 [Amblyomma americanum]
MSYPPGTWVDAPANGEVTNAEVKENELHGARATGQVMGNRMNRTLQQPGTTSSSRRQLSYRETKTASHLLVLTFWGGSCVAALGLSLVLLLAVSLIRRRPPAGHEVCRSHACNEFSRRLRASINESVSPCDSFAHFVCDGWHRANKLSVREASFKAVLGRISRLTSIMSRDGDSEHARRCAFFGSCKDVFTGRSDEAAAVRAALREARIVWPRRPREPVDALQAILYSSLKLHWSAVLHVQLSEVDGKTHVLLTPVHGFAVPLEKALELRGRITAKRQYFDLLFEQIGALPAHTDDSVSLDETLTVEERLLWPLRNNFLTPARKDFIESSALFLHAANLSEARWKKALSALGASVSREVIFWTENAGFVMKFFNLWLKHGEADAFLFVSWCTVQLAALYANRRLIISYYGEEERAAVMHGAFCLGKAYLILGNAAFSRYRTDILFPGARISAESMTIAVREAFLRRLTRWEFYDEKETVIGDWNSTTDVFSIIDAVYKANTANGSQRLPNVTGSLVHNWRTLAVQYSLYASNAAYTAIQRLELHVQLKNDFALLPHAFSFPLYAVDGVPAVNFAGVGSEMTLAMSRLLLDAYSASKGAREAFDRFKECLGTAEPASSLLAFLALDTLAEVLEEGSWMSAEKRLVGFEVYSTPQLFFMAACYAKCGGASTDAAEDYCDAALRNVEAFPRAFHCTLGSPMNPERKCSL